VELLAEALPAIPPAAAPVAPPPVDDAARLRTGRRLRASGIAVGSFGIAALAVGAGLASLTASLERSINHPPDGGMFDPDVVRRANSAQSLEITFFTLGAPQSPRPLRCWSRRLEHRGVLGRRCRRDRLPRSGSLSSQ
jgi:hypothetical protein